VHLGDPLYLVLFPVLVVISLHLFEIALLLLEIMASAILMSIFHRQPRQESGPGVMEPSAALSAGNLIK
jgi:hypothetical protein